MNTATQPQSRLFHPAMRAIVGQAPALHQVLERAARVAPTRLPVLVTGESGTGKELLARALHELGASPAGPFVAVNCGALARELAESELFGHERGAFTGAGARKVGWFEEASGGTLVLDEVGELPLDLQPKLLRVLETGRLRRVGGNGEVAVNVRVVALTLRDLRSEARRGLFRLDLYHRLAGCELRLPTLRERPSDVPLLTEHFLAELAAEIGERSIDAEAMALLRAHDWPGNVRELRNVLRRAVALSDGVIHREDLALDTCTFFPCATETWRSSRAADAPEPDTATATAPAAAGADVLMLAGKSFEEMQNAIFRWALERSDGSRRRAAQALGVSRSTFCDRVRKLGLSLGSAGSTAHEA
jgi:two-component system nitrogen regulation response regulator GlnG